MTLKYQTKISLVSIKYFVICLSWRHCHMHASVFNTNQFITIIIIFYAINEWKTLFPQAHVDCGWFLWHVNFCWVI